MASKLKVPDIETSDYVSVNAELAKRYRTSVGNTLVGLKQASRYGVMSVPPTITKSNNATSILDPTYTAGATLYQPDAGNTRMTMEGGEFEPLTNGLYTTLVDKHITDIFGATTTTANGYRIRFLTDAPAVDFCFTEYDLNDFTVAIDGQLVYRRRPFSFAISGGFRYVNVSFGADAITYGRCVATITGATITAGGSGYSVDDIITLDGGSGVAGGTPTQLRVTQAAGGAVTRARSEVVGAYTALPTGTMSQASVSPPGGTGFQMSSSGWEPQHSTRKVRRWEAFVRTQPIGAAMFGLVTTASDLVLPWPASPHVPKLCVVGDSLQEGSFIDYSAGFIGLSIAQLLGLQDRCILSAQSGTGWNTDASPAARWSNAYRVADFIRYAADIYLFIGSQNDTVGSPLTTAVTNTLNSILTALPNALIVGLPNVVGADASKAAAIAAGFAAASDQNRVRFINAQSPIQWLGSYNSSLFTISSDTAHLGQDGHDFYASTAGEQVYNALLDMCFT